MKIIALLICILTANFAIAQDSTHSFRNTYKHQLGFAAGFTTGYGLSYRYMPARFGAQVTFAPYHDQDNDRYSAGLTLLYTLVQGKTTNLFLYQGTHYYYHGYSTYESTDPSIPAQKYRYKDEYVNVGLGIGIEITLAKRVGFNLMTGYAAYDNFQSLNITGETALFYKF